MMADEDEVSEFEVESCIIEDDFSFSVCTFDERSLHEPSKYHTNHVVSKRNTIDLNVTNDPARSPLAVLEAGGIAPRTTMEKKKKGKKRIYPFWWSWLYDGSTCLCFDRDNCSPSYEIEDDGWNTCIG
mmetsp:Transcript_9845/g.21388  ORF Transcript_9845/g.21388 Transcript_9845/m.21388 type:complete len:128 (-) Transcript_9845:263-646(-)